MGHRPAARGAGGVTLTPAPEPGADRDRRRQVPVSVRRARCLPPGPADRALREHADRPPEDQAVDRVERVPVGEARQSLGLEEGRLDQAAARRPSRPPRTGARPGRAPSSPPAGAAAPAGGPPPPARSRSRRRPAGGPGRGGRGASRRRRRRDPSARGSATAGSRTASRRRRRAARPRRTRAPAGRRSTCWRRSTIIPSRRGRRDDRLALSGAASASNQVDSMSWRSVRSMARWSASAYGSGWRPKRWRRPRVADDHLVAQALDERPGDARGHRRDQAHPVRGEARREHRDRDHQPTQAAQPGVGPHHVAVREDVRAADLDDPGHLGVVERAHEVVEHVADADRLAARAHPAGRDHHRQPLGEVAQDLERRAAGADDHRRPELGDRHAVRRQLRARSRGGWPGGARGRPRRRPGRRGRRSAPRRRAPPPARSCAPPAGPAPRSPRSPPPIEWAR